MDEVSRHWIMNLEPSTDSSLGCLTTERVSPGAATENLWTGIKMLLWPHPLANKRVPGESRRWGSSHSL